MTESSLFFNSPNFGYFFFYFYFLMKKEYIIDIICYNKYLKRYYYSSRNDK